MHRPKRVRYPMDFHPPRVAPHPLSPGCSFCWSNAGMCLPRRDFHFPDKTRPQRHLPPLRGLNRQCTGTPARHSLHQQQRSDRNRRRIMHGPLDPMQCHVPVPLMIFPPSIESWIHSSCGTGVEIPSPLRSPRRHSTQSRRASGF